MGRQASVERSKVPITVVGGWCASSRAALAAALAALAAPPRGVIVTPEPQLGSGEARVVSVDEEVFRKNGLAHCPCCAVRFDLLWVVPSLAYSRRPPERIVVATADDTDVAIVAQTLLSDARLERLVELDSIVVVVDGPQASVRLVTEQPLAPSSPAADQLAFADHVVVAGADRLTETCLSALAAALHQLNPLAELWLDDPSELDVSRLTGARSFHLDTTARRVEACAPPIPSDLDGGGPRAVVVELDGMLDAELLNRWLNRLLLHHGHDLLRLQGVFRVRDRPTRWVCSGVRTCIRWGYEARPAGSGSRAVLVGRGLDAGLVRAWLVEALA